MPINSKTHTVSFGMVGAHVVFLSIFLGLWQFAVAQGWIDQTFFGSPLGIVMFLFDGFLLGTRLWWELAWSLGGTVSAFVLGSVAAILAALVFINYPRLEKFADPYLSALNSMPRIALVPLFILWFGLGVASKIAMGFTLTFFIVLSSAVAGIRGVNQDHLTLMSTLGARPRQIFSLVTLPNAVPVIFSGLRLGLVYALLGVIGSEIIASEHGLGQQISYLASTFNMNGVLALLIVLAALATLINYGMSRLEHYLLRWQ
ncbi:ABC transporter permease [Cupriavidus necator]|uniref:ABC transporter permease n=1 Tax=Cupriavidus necator TaxID=106590 RepID=A0A1U9UN34_CUPNE|nr:ABC transporter permease [Cupriavidus necator]AQV94092.1 ABC transporter permease [Cupriavidus necator]